MAKRIEELLVELRIDGLQEVNKLSGSFRELSKVTKLNDQEIRDVRQRLIDFGATAGNTQQVNKGLTEAFKGLIGEARRGSEVWSQLTADLQGFQQASRRTDGEIQALRRGILTIAAGADQSQKSLREYIGELTRLRSEASITGAAFGELGQDIAALTGQLQRAEAQTVQTSRAFGRVLGQSLASTSAGVRVQLQSLRELINEQRQAIDSVDSLAARERNLTANRTARAAAEERLNRALARQRQLNYGESIRGGRETARAGAAAFNDPEFFSFQTISRRFGELPNTTAGLNQELSELSERLANTTRGSNLYVETSNRMAQVMRELRTEITGTASTFDTLARSQAAAQRQMGKRAGIEEYYAPTDLMPPAVGGYRDPRTGAMIAPGAGPFPIAPQADAYPQPIGPQAFPEAGTRAQEQIERSLEDVNRIYENSKIQRAEIQAKYDQIYIDNVFAQDDKRAQLERQIFDKEIADFDRRMDARDRKRRGRLTAGQAVQSAGAVISGGIFGGPEGFVGGLGGFAAGLAMPALGPVGGAFAGAAAGAQVGAFREAMGAAAAYAAEVRRLELALQGIVYSFEDYRTALGAIQSTSEQFNIPIQQSTQQFTRLSAAVIGSGGTIKDAENTFKGITASILATGGSIQDVNGALLAASQVFSKGKVSAEELRQQIGERLAGAFALFAESSGISTQQLDKDLQRGEVTLAQFVKFVEFSLAKYGQTAKIIAASPEQAGARLDLALKDLQRNVGDALGPTGAAFQDFATTSIKALDGLIGKLIELKAIQPGAGFYVSQVLTKQLSMGELESMLLKAGAAETAARNQAGRGGLGFIADLLPDIRATSKEAAILQEALIKLRLTEKQANKDKKQRTDEESAADKERLGKSYLQAVEQREESIAQSRKQREEQIASIRKQAVDQVAQIERGLADRRRDMEREIARIARERSDSSEDLEFKLRRARGEDAGLIEAEQAFSEINREVRDSRIELEQRLADDKEAQERTIADFQKGVARQIQEANEAHTKRMGEVQKDYARQVGKIIEEGTGKAAKRLEIGGKLAALAIERSHLDAMRVQAGAGLGPASPIYQGGQPQYGGPLETVPDAYRNLDKRIFDLQKELLRSKSNASPDIGTQFLSLLGDEGGFEDVAGLQPLPVKRMMDQAARPFLRLWKQIGDAADTYYRYGQGEIKQLLRSDPARRQEVLQRVQRTEQVRQNWNPLEAESRERLNRTNPSPRSAPSSMSASAFTDMLRGMQRDLLENTLSHMSWSGGVVKGDMSTYLTENQLKMIRSGVSDLVGVYGSELLESFVGGAFKAAIRQSAELEGIKVKPRAAAPSEALKPLGGDEEWMKRYMEQTEPPLIVPGVQNRIEGAMLPGGAFDVSKLATEFGQVAAASALHGLLAQHVPESQRMYAGPDMPTYVPPSANLTNQLRETQGQQGGAAINQKAEDERRGRFADVAAGAQAYTDNLREQLKLVQDQARYINLGINEGLARELANVDQLYEKDRKRLEQTRVGAINKGMDASLAQSYYEAELDNLDAVYAANVNLTRELEKQSRIQIRPSAIIKNAAQEAEFELATLSNVGNQVVGAADAIGDSFGNAFKGVISGSMSAQQALASFFQSTADYFLDMASKMIAKWITMKIIGLVTSFFPGANSGLSDLGAGASINNPLGQLGNIGGAYAKGGAFSSNGVVPFARGGIVNKPTMFKFANGGAMQNGLMGEAGPEAIMPLKRGSDGKLGVAGGGGNTNVVVNVDATGSTVEGDAPNANQLGKVLAVAVQAELVKQQRPGGLLSGTR